MNLIKMNNQTINSMTSLVLVPISEPVLTKALNSTDNILWSGLHSNVCSINKKLRAIIHFSFEELIDSNLNYERIRL